MLDLRLTMRKSRSSSDYQILDEKTGRYLETDWPHHKMVMNQIRNYDKVAPEDRHKLTLPQTYKRVTVTLRKPVDCAACGKSSDCAKTPGPGVRHSEVWICERCWKTERRERRNYNTRRGLSRGNPDFLVIRSWPKEDTITETWQYAVYGSPA